MNSGLRRTSAQQWPTIDTSLIALVSVAAILLLATFFTRGLISLVLLSAGLFTALAALALAINLPALLAIDTSVLNFFEPYRTTRRDEAATGVWAFIGKPVHVLIPAVVLGALFSVLARSVMPAMSLIGAIGIGVVIEETMKAVFERTATAGPLLEYPHSFPSGHVTGTGALLGMVAVCIGAGRSSALQARLAVLVVAGVLFVAILALFLSAHTFTDVIGGMLLSGAIVSLGAAALDVSIGRRRRDAETHPLETART